MNIQFRSRMHQNFVNWAEKVAFFKKIYRKNHGMWFDTFGFSSKYFKICQLLDEISQLYFFSYNNCYFDYQKNSVKMQNHGIKNLSNRKSKIKNPLNCWSNYISQKKNRQINEFTLSHWKSKLCQKLL